MKEITPIAITEILDVQFVNFIFRKVNKVLQKSNITLKNTIDF